MFVRLRLCLAVILGLVSITSPAPAQAGICEDSIKCLLDNANNLLPEGGLCGPCSGVPTEALVNAIKAAAKDPDINTLCSASVNIDALVDLLKEGFDAGNLATSLVCAAFPKAGTYSSELNELNSWCRNTCQKQYPNNLGKLLPCVRGCDKGLGEDLICDGMTRAGAVTICNALDSLSDTVSADIQHTCDCDFSAGGCTISTAAPYGKACKCSYSGGWTCSGDVVNCPEGSKKWECDGKKLGDCLRGGGDCGGYEKDSNCDCDYHEISFGSGGCKISDAAPKRTACKCAYRGAWTCTGQPVMCKDEESVSCRFPSKSKASCEQGGGDCDGYK